MQIFPESVPEYYIVAILNPGAWPVCALRYCTPTQTWPQWYFSRKHSLSNLHKPARSLSVLRYSSVYEVGWADVCDQARKSERFWAMPMSQFEDWGYSTSRNVSESITREGKRPWNFNLFKSLSINVRLSLRARLHAGVPVSLTRKLRNALKKKSDPQSNAVVVKECLPKPCFDIFCEMGWILQVKTVYRFS